MYENTCINEKKGGTVFKNFVQLIDLLFLSILIQIGYKENIDIAFRTSLVNGER